MEAGPSANQIPKKYAVDKEIKFSIKLTKLQIIIIIFIMLILIWAITSTVLLAEKFENKNYDPYGTGIRFLQARDDTGSPSTNMNERKYQVATSATKISPLTSSPEGPNFSEGYNIDAKIENGSVMLERENFENLALGSDELEMALKGR